MLNVNELYTYTKEIFLIYINEYSQNKIAMSATKSRNIFVRRLTRLPKQFPNHIEVKYEENLRSDNLCMTVKDLGWPNHPQTKQNHEHQQIRNSIQTMGRPPIPLRNSRPSADSLSFLIYRQGVI